LGSRGVSDRKYRGRSATCNRPKVARFGRARRRCGTHAADATIGSRIGDAGSDATLAFPSRPADATMRRKWARGAPSERFSAAATLVAYRPETSVESDGAGTRPLIVWRRRRVRGAPQLRFCGHRARRKLGGGEAEGWWKRDSPAVYPADERAAAARTLGAREAAPLGRLSPPPLRRGAAGAPN